MVVHSVDSLVAPKGYWMVEWMVCYSAELMVLSLVDLKAVLSVETMVVKWACW